MPYRYRPGVDTEQRFQELEKEFGLDNIVDIPINETFPEAGPNQGKFSIVKDSGTYYLVFIAEGTRLRVPFTAF